MQDDRENQGDREGRQGIEIDAQRVFEDVAELVAVEEFREEFEADPFARVDATGDFIIPESDLHAVHRGVLEHDQDRHWYQQHDIQRAEAPELLAHPLLERRTGNSF